MIDYKKLKKLAKNMNDEVKLKELTKDIRELAKNMNVEVKFKELAKNIRVLAILYTIKATTFYICLTAFVITLLCIIAN